MEEKSQIGIVGPCSAGKSTLIASLIKLGYYARHIAQEHSFTPRMWQIISRPDILIYLDVSYEESMRRRPLDLSPDEFEEQLRRLSHARNQANLYVHTDNLTPQAVLDEVIKYIKDYFSM